LVQSKDRIIGDQQNIVWSLPIYFAKTWRLNLNHLEEGNWADGQDRIVQPVGSRTMTGT
jgi:hypothetical protein